MSDHAKSAQFAKLEVILGNSNKRFSGVTSTMLQVFPHQQERMPIAIMGNYNVPDHHPTISFSSALRLCQTPLSTGAFRIFHARRNDEMLQALALRALGAKLRILFTSTAQRHHSHFTRILMSKMDGIITTCAAANSYLKTPADVIIPHGIDTERYKPVTHKEDAWAKLGLPGRYGIGIFGRVRAQKGHDILIEAILPLLSTYKDATLVFIGETKATDQAFLENLLTQMDKADHRDRIHILGEQPFSRIPELMASMSLVCALSRNEGYGLTIPEAMACGTAVLASKEGAWEDIIEEGIQGITVPTGDVPATRSALEYFLKEPNTMLTMGEQGVKRIQSHFTIQQEARALCEFYQSRASLETCF